MVRESSLSLRLRLSRRGKTRRAALHHISFTGSALVAEGLPQLINDTLGKTLKPNQALPRWFTEGVATWVETETDCTDPNWNYSGSVEPDGSGGVKLHVVGENDGRPLYRVFLNDEELGNFQPPLASGTTEEGEAFQVSLPAVAESSYHRLQD